ncbi:MAG: potassium channel family protein [Candidatus Micrarchaeia archaeon]|jgi:voltage-gated potassium channel
MGEVEYKDHVIVCGYGIVGERIVDILLEHKISVVVIEIDHKKVELIRERGIPVIEGDATTSKALKEAGIANAKAIAIAMDDDAKNLFATITAKSLNENIVIATRANDEVFETKLADAGAKFVATPNRSASDELFNEITKGL